MNDPVFLTSGNTYDRQSVLDHLTQVGPWDPLTKQKLDSNALFDNNNLKK